MADITGGPFGANKRLMHRSKLRFYSTPAVIDVHFLNDRWRRFDEHGSTLRGAGLNLCRAMNGDSGTGDDLQDCKANFEVAWARIRAALAACQGRFPTS
jgi:hypothetical protein